MAEAKIYYINLDRCRDRRDHMESVFSSDSLVRVSGVDGLSFSTGEAEPDGRYCWRAEVLSNFFQFGILPSEADFGRLLSPLEVACNLSHAKALRRFLQTNEDYGIILEDDVEPISAGSILEKINFPIKGDMLYLCGPDHPGDRLRLYPNGQVKWARTLMAYVVSRKAAKLILQAMYPMYYLLDTQAMVRLFKSLEPFKRNWVSPKLKDLERFCAYGLFDPIIKHSEYAKITTFTSNGEKPWLPEEAIL